MLSSKPWKNIEAEWYGRAQQPFMHNRLKLWVLLEDSLLLRLLMFLSNSCYTYKTIFYSSILKQNMQSRTKFMKQCQEIKQNWKAQETSDTCFCVLFEYQYRSFISEGRLTTRLRLHPFLRFFQYVLISW